MEQAYISEGTSIDKVRLILFFVVYIIRSTHRKCGEEPFVFSSGTPPNTVGNMFGVDITRPMIPPAALTALRTLVDKKSVETSALRQVQPIAAKATPK